MNDQYRLFNRSYLKEMRRKLRKNQTPEEKKLWFHLRNRKLNGKKFRRQYSVGNYILDFYCPKHKLAIEIDGQHHKNSKRDYYRDKYLSDHEITVLRFWNWEVRNNLEKVLEKISQQFNGGLGGDRTRV